MSSRVVEEIQQFRDLASQLAVHMSMSKPCEDLYIFEPRGVRKVLSSRKEVDLTVMALTHGNEVAGLSVLNCLIEEAIEESGLDFTFAAVLGNTDAARADQRFVTSDMNRSFNRKKTVSPNSEQKRADLISQHVLSKTALLIDLHQTIEPTLSPFFIFPFSLQGYRLARSISKDVPIVTHWSGGFSKDGMCTDEFTNHCGGVGISLELGQMGFDTEQRDFGKTLLAEFTASLKSSFDLASLSAPIDDVEQDSNVWTWAHVEPYPKGERVALVEGLCNFKDVAEGETVAHFDKIALKAPLTGPVMFPKYIRDQNKPPPAELIRYLRKASSRELAQISSESIKS